MAIKRRSSTKKRGRMSEGKKEEWKKKEKVSKRRERKGGGHGDNRGRWEETRAHAIDHSLRTNSNKKRRAGPGNWASFGQSIIFPLVVQNIDQARVRSIDVPISLLGYLNVRSVCSLIIALSIITTIALTQCWAELKSDKTIEGAKKNWTKKKKERESDEEVFVVVCWRDCLFNQAQLSFSHTSSSLFFKRQKRDEHGEQCPIVH